MLFRSAAAPHRDRAIFSLRNVGSDEQLLRTARWALRIPPAPADEPARAELYVKPDDYWEVNDVADRLPEGARDDTRHLWATHRTRLAGRLGPLRVGAPRPDLPRRDRFALRPALGLLLFVAWFAALDDHRAPLLAAFHGETVAVVPPRLDAWIEPPDHTEIGRAHV